MWRKRAGTFYEVISYRFNIHGMSFANAIMFLAATLFFRLPSIHLFPACRRYFWTSPEDLKSSRNLYSSIISFVNYHYYLAKCSTILFLVKFFKIFYLYCSLSDRNSCVLLCCLLMYPFLAANEAAICPGSAVQCDHLSQTPKYVISRCVCQVISKWSK